ncbi:MAG: M23 family metallopeptidase [Verrucomicrobiae bacterium]|nr:M23 family metallopeptidase [Verrucomicrobiae bacterium]
MADGFDLPVGKKDGKGYYIHRGVTGSHDGEDWNGTGMGDTDFGDPVFAVGHGIVTEARDIRMGYGKTVFITHRFRENGKIREVESMYSHLSRITVRRGQIVRRGDMIGKIGDADGQYVAHLHFEMRKKSGLQVGNVFQKNRSVLVTSPFAFISQRRPPGSPTLALADKRPVPVEKTMVLAQSRISVDSPKPAQTAALLRRAESGQQTEVRAELEPFINNSGLPAGTDQKTDRVASPTDTPVAKIRVATVPSASPEARQTPPISRPMTVAVTVESAPAPVKPRQTRMVEMKLDDLLEVPVAPLQKGTLTAPATAATPPTGSNAPMERVMTEDETRVRQAVTQFVDQVQVTAGQIGIFLQKIEQNRKTLEEPFAPVNGSAGHPSTQHQL